MTFSDAMAALEVQRRTLNWGYMQKWAQELGVADLLERARIEAGVLVHLCISAKHKREGEYRRRK